EANELTRKIAAATATSNASQPFSMRAARPSRRSGIWRATLCPSAPCPSALCTSAMGRLRFLQDHPALAFFGTGVDGNGDDDDRAGNRHLGEGRDIDDRQRILDDAEEERTEHRAGDGADAAGDRYAADDASGDDVEFEAGRDIDIGDRIARNPEVA